jgi:hypothetical protein
VLSEFDRLGGVVLSCVSSVDRALLTALKIVVVELGGVSISDRR